MTKITVNENQVLVKFFYTSKDGEILKTNGLSHY